MWFTGTWLWLSVEEQIICSEILSPFNLKYPFLVRDSKHSVQSFKMYAFFGMVCKVAGKFKWHLIRVFSWLGLFQAMIMCNWIFFYLPINTVHGRDISLHLTLSVWLSNLPIYFLFTDFSWGQIENVSIFIYHNYKDCLPSDH